jgi:hypothetical protein
MDRYLLRKSIAVAERHIAECEVRIAKQRELIANMEKLGVETARSKALLATFQQSLGLHIADYDRLQRELMAIETGFPRANRT